VLASLATLPDFVFIHDAFLIEKKQKHLKIPEKHQNFTKNIKISKNAKKHLNFTKILKTTKFH